MEKNWEQIFNERAARQQALKEAKRLRQRNNPRTKEAKRVYYLNHQESLRKKQKDYHQKFPEKVAAQNAAFYRRRKALRRPSLSYPPAVSAGIEFKAPGGERIKPIRDVVQTEGPRSGSCGCDF